MRLCFVCRYLCKSNPALVDSFESALFGPFQTVLSTETAADFGPYVFQILAQLLELRSDLSAPYIAIFPALLAPALWKNAGNVPAVTRLLQAYMHKPSFSSSLLSGNARLEGILGIFQELLRLRSTEGYALELLTSIVTDLDLASVSKYLPAVFNSMLFPKLQPAAKPTAKLFKGATMFFLGFLAKHGLDTVVRVLATVQPGILAMLLDKIMLPNVHFATSEGERRTAVITLTNLLTRTPSFLQEPTLLQLWPRTCLETVRLLMPKASKELSAALLAGATADAGGVSDSAAAVGAEDDPDDLLLQADKGFSTAYARLVFATGAERDFFPAVTQNTKEYFGLAMDAICTQYTGKVTHTHTHTQTQTQTNKQTNRHSAVQPGGT